jgi:hypothetical protein
MVDDKQYLSETILQVILRKLEELKQQSQEQKPINLSVLQALVEQAQQ